MHLAGRPPLCGARAGRSVLVDEGRIDAPNLCTGCRAAVLMAIDAGHGGLAELLGMHA